MTGSYVQTKAEVSRLQNILNTLEELDRNATEMCVCFPSSQIVHFLLVLTYTVNVTCADPFLLKMSMLTTCCSLYKSAGVTHSGRGCINLPRPFL